MNNNSTSEPTGKRGLYYRNTETYIYREEELIIHRKSELTGRQRVTYNPMTTGRGSGMRGLKAGGSLQ